MKLLLAIVACLLTAHAVRAESYTVEVQETATIDLAGATSAWTTNPDIADVTMAGPGRVSVRGHSSGTTQLVVLTASGTQAFLIRVSALSRPLAARPAAGEPLARYEGRYSSGAARLQNTLDVITSDDEKGRRSEFHLLHIHDRLSGSGDPADSIASMFFRSIRPGRTLTLLDEMVDESRMTISNTQVRGLHLQQGPLVLHAGYASSAMYDGFFIPTERRWVAGAGYDLDAGSVRLTPSAYGFFSRPARTAARRGAVGALTAEYSQDDRLYLRGEAGLSRSLAAAGEVRYLTARGRLAASFSVKPEDYPTLGLSDRPGARVLVDWTGRFTPRLSIVSYGTFDRFKLGTQGQTMAVASSTLRYSLTSRLALLGGADASEVRSGETSIRTIGVPLGVSYEAPSFGFATSYRTVDNSIASRRGDVLRLSAHAGRGRFTVSGWAERQRQAPTLELIFREAPGLELALLRLGISVRTPEDVARALRDHAALIDLDLITGVRFDLTPRRLQAGLSLGWLASAPRSDRLRLLAVYSRDERIGSTRDSAIATLTYSRRIFGATDLYGSYSWWQTAVDGTPAVGSSVDIGVRQQFNGLPDFLRRSGTIEGFAFLDPGMLGVRGAGTEPLADLVITLDGDRITRTGSNGAYAFDDVTPGQHRIAARLPLSPPAYFTTASHQESIRPGARVDFGLVWAGGRIDGRITNDAGAGLPSATFFAAAQSGPPILATSDANGRFAFVVPPGAFRIWLAVESLPIGYSIAGPQEQHVTVAADEPQLISFEVRALRSVGGSASGASAVRIDSLGREAPVDAEGKFLFRTMPPGTFLLAARIGGRTVTRAVTLPPEPAMIQDVVLGAPASPVQGAPATREAASSPLGEGDRIRRSVVFHVQAGAFRLAGNATAAKRRVEQIGVPVFIERAGSLHLVTAGPFASREAAEEAAARLEAAGIEWLVTTSPSAVMLPGSRASHVVQAGAFREKRNAASLIDRLRRGGETPFSVASPPLTLVYIGPFPTLQHALTARDRLRLAGIDAFVTKR